ncbi:hypothetical protein CMK12_12780 [Candidatus Poribacteria bacterium]|nr:hypothetical protein [Candidatus Poribacteria bacterium]
MRVGAVSSRDEPITIRVLHPLPIYAGGPHWTGLRQSTSASAIWPIRSGMESQLCIHLDVGKLMHRVAHQFPLRHYHIAEKRWPEHLSILGSVINATRAFDCQGQFPLNAGNAKHEKLVWHLMTFLRSNK